MNQKLNAESHVCICGLRKLSGAEWARRLNTVEPINVRILAACVVFYDYTPSENSKNQDRLYEIHHLVDAWNMEVESSVSQPELRDALMKIGYNEQLAEIRSTNEKI